ALLAPICMTSRTAAVTYKRGCAGRLSQRPQRRKHQTVGLDYAFVAKNSSAVLVLVCCSPSRSTPRPDRKTRASAAVWKASEGRTLVDSSTIWEPSGYNPPA